MTPEDVYSRGEAHQVIFCVRLPPGSHPFGPQDAMALGETEDGFGVEVYFGRR